VIFSKPGCPHLRARPQDPRRQRRVRTRKSSSARASRSPRSARFRTRHGAPGLHRRQAHRRRGGRCSVLRRTRRKAAA
jgi:hypothetical protein